MAKNEFIKIGEQIRLDTFQPFNLYKHENMRYK